MRKVERRVFACILLALVLFLGLSYFVTKLIKEGEEWSTFKGNMHVYKDGQLNRGTICDRNGEVLLSCTENGIIYTDNVDLRKATVHTIGDIYGNISNGLLNIKKAQLIGYDLVNGIYSKDGLGAEISLTLDAKACETAYDALGRHNGVVAVFNYETGEIMCLVSKPTFDPVDVPNNPKAGIFFNKFTQGTMIPGSTFKLLTAAAAIENIENLEGFSFSCDGASEVMGDTIKCTYAHGTVNFEEALAKSCNGAFGELAIKIGAEKFEEYTDKLGFTSVYDIDGIITKPSTFEFPKDNDFNLAWAGIGQYKDQVNPCAMMVYVGAIANEGEAVMPKLIKDGSINTKSYLSKDTANKLKSLMKNNVIKTYGENNFMGLDIYAKSGTAETGDGNQPDGWFTGFIDNEDYPYAFIVCVENSGSGSSSAGPVARKVLQSMIK